MTPKIADAELEVMRVLRREGRPLSFAEIRTELESKMNWSKSTIQTLVVRLRDKGVISAETHYVALYSPNVSEQDYVSAEGRTFLDKLFGGSAKKLVASLYQSGHLGEGDIEELRRFFSMEEDEP